MSTFMNVPVVLLFSNNESIEEKNDEFGTQSQYRSHQFHVSKRNYEKYQKTVSNMSDIFIHLLVAKKF